MRRIVPILLLLAALPLTATADWLVTREGGRVETKGPWKVKGKIVVFTQKNGTLSSMRLSEVDLDKSAEVTYEAAKPPPPEEEEAPKETVLELTDKDVKRAAPLPPRLEPGELAPAETPEGVTINEPYGLLDWNLRRNGRGIEIRGTMVYNGEEVDRVEGLNMIVSLNTADDVQFAQTSATLTTPALRTGAATTFRAVFTDVDVEDYSVTVEVESRETRQR